jgi:hypothetical protein
MYGAANSQIASERVLDLQREAERTRLVAGVREPAPRRTGRRGWAPLTTLRRRVARA